MTNPLQPYREKIDALDDQIIELLAQRMDIVREVGVIKARENIALVQHARVKEVCDRCAALARDKGLDESLVRKLYETIIDHAHEMESEVGEKI